MQASLYPDNYRERARECLARAGYRCEHCGVRQGTWRIGKRSHEFYSVYLHAAHINHDPHNPQAELRALCPACHLRHDRRSERPQMPSRRLGYAVVSMERLITYMRCAGLSITQDGERSVWQIGSLSGEAQTPLEAIACALHWLLMEAAS